jgi:PEP-CTERM motif
MKIYFALLVAMCFVATSSSSLSQTLDWGSEVFSDLVDSEERPLDETFIFEVGAFEIGFVPDANNVAQWSSNWQVFDRAIYNQENGYFASTAHMLDDGTSDSNPPGGLSFEGLSAFIWVRNGDDPIVGTEWLLTRASNWVFPSANPGCCDNELQLQWSVSDLGTNGETPIWGGYDGVQGGGVFTNTGTHTLQTHTFVPEPSSLLMLALAGVFMARRRR